MRVALVYIPAKSPEALVALAKAMARSLEAAGPFCRPCGGESR